MATAERVILEVGDTEGVAAAVALMEGEGDTEGENDTVEVRVKGRVVATGEVVVDAVEERVAG